LIVNMNSLVSVSLLIGAAAAETIHGVVVFSRHGDRESLATPPSLSSELKPQLDAIMSTTANIG
jgi:hypothetical protein